MNGTFTELDGVLKLTLFKLNRNFKYLQLRKHNDDLRRKFARKFLVKVSETLEVIQKHSSRFLKSVNIEIVCPPKIKLVSVEITACGFVCRRVQYSFHFGH